MTVDDLKEQQTFHTSCLGKIGHTVSVHSIVPPKMKLIFFRWWSSDPHLICPVIENTFPCYLNK